MNSAQTDSTRASAFQEASELESRGEKVKKELKEAQRAAKRDAEAATKALEAIQHAQRNVNAAFKKDAKLAKEVNKVAKLVKRSTIADRYPIQLVYNKFDRGNKQTDIVTREFYDNPAFNGMKRFVLTNGANKELRPGGGGTNQAITTLQQGKTNFFNHDNYELVHDPNNTQLHKSDTLNAIINDPQQVATLKGTKYGAGTVWYVSVPTAKSEGTFGRTIAGVYHINGINWNPFAHTSKEARDANERISVPLVKSYYTAILDHFTKNTEGDVIHLAQVPGALFGGTAITAGAFKDAVLEWVTKRKLHSRPIIISVDLDDKQVGIPNYGNTCFFNSAVQFIANIPEFKQAVASMEGNTPTDEAIKRMFASLDDLSREDVKTTCEKLLLETGDYHFGMQYDADELLKRLVEYIIKHAQRAQRLKVQQLISLLKTYRDQGTTEDGYTAKRDNVKQELIHIIHPNDNGTFIISFKDEKEVNPEEPYVRSQFTKLDKDNRELGLTEVEPVLSDRKKIEITQIPSANKYIIIQFSRLGYDPSNFTPVLNTSKIDLPNVLEVDGQKYTVQSVIGHSGSYRGGHYVNYSKRNGIWYYFSDSTVKQLGNDWKPVLATINNGYKIVNALYRRE